MRTTKQILPIVALLLGLSGCQTSDDPREGGLIGYWATGDEGYQRRLDDRQTELDQVERNTRQEQSRSENLAIARDQMKAELKAQREKLAELQAETEKMRVAVQQMEAATAEKEAEKAKLMASLSETKQSMDMLSEDTSLDIEEKRQRIAQLQEEVSLLLEQYSLLTTL